MTSSIALIKKSNNDMLDILYEKYGNNDYIIKRIYNHIVNYLPKTLENELKMHEKRVSRSVFLNAEQQSFIQIFLSKNQYFYLQSSCYFYEYDNQNYTIINEDDIIYKLLSTISRERILMQWKYKTKFNIIRLIKERSLFSSIPDTATIQMVLNVLNPSFFTSKTQTKYFLTIIGDAILKKNQNLIFLVNSKTKKLINEICNIAHFSISNTTISNNFITKHHETHLYDNYRLLKINDSFSFELWKDVILKIGLNLLCLATHYSNRYGNSDIFIENSSSDEEFKLYVFYLKNNNQSKIIETFCASYVQVVNSENALKIEWKKMHFIWKQFLHQNSLPAIMYSNILKTQLKLKYEYDDKTDSFYNVTSKFLPVVYDFINFWEKTIQTNSDTNPEIDELEVDEICVLFKCWIRQHNETSKTSGIINEDNVLKIIGHFFPDIEVVGDKYILNTKCVLWNKNKDIDNSMEQIKTRFKDKNERLLSFDESYNCYCRFIGEPVYKFIVSKKYFNKYLYSKIYKYVVYDTFITDKWLSDDEL